MDYFKSQQSANMNRNDSFVEQQRYRDQKIYEDDEPVRKKPRKNTIWIVLIVVLLILALMYSL